MADLVCAWMLALAVLAGTHVMHLNAYDVVKLRTRHAFEMPMMLWVRLSLIAVAQVWEISRRKSNSSKSECLLTCSRTPPHAKP